MQTPLRKVPDMVIVPVPFQIKTMAALHSSYEREVWMSTRMSQHDKDLILRAATFSETTRSMFMRWVSVAAATQVINHINGKQINVAALLRQLGRNIGQQ